MTTWEEAGNRLTAVLTAILTGDVPDWALFVPTELHHEVYGVVNTLPVAGTMMPHDVTAIARLLELAYAKGYRDGRMCTDQPEPTHHYDLGGES